MTFEILRAAALVLLSMSMLIYCAIIAGMYYRHMPLPLASVLVLTFWAVALLLALVTWSAHLMLAVIVGVELSLIAWIAGLIRGARLDREHDIRVGKAERLIAAGATRDEIAKYWDGAG